MKRFFSGKRIAGFIALAIIGVLLFGWIVMSIWNTVLVSVIPVIHTVTFGQALAILVLSKILFGGFRGGGWRGRGGGWGYKMSEKWSSMTPEEQEQFKQNWRKRCGKKETTNAGSE